MKVRVTLVKAPAKPPAKPADKPAEKKDAEKPDEKKDEKKDAPAMPGPKTLVSVILITDASTGMDDKAKPKK
jgi:hypothetical protein